MPTRPAAVAGRFYPADPDALRRQVRRWLDATAVEDTEGAAPPIAALIAPHAGYRYSGAVAAAAYARLAPVVRHVRRVILVGPAHFVPVRGVATSGADAFDTPLGLVPVDRPGVDRALAVAGVCIDDAAHGPEHALEVQLPFLVQLLEDFAIVPLLVGVAADETVARAMEAAWARPDTIAVISSDLSHGLPRAIAERRDASTAAAIEALDPGLIGRHAACGGTGIRALLQVARARRLTARTLALATSADAGAAANRVVGYGAFVFREGEP
jgi:MEMO1 family protein